MKIEVASQGIAAVGTTAGAAATVALDAISMAWFGIPIAAVTAAATGALVPNLVLDEEKALVMARRWIGSVAFSLSLTALVVAVSGSERELVIGIAALLAMFARDIFAALRGQVPPIINAVREKFTGKKEGTQ